MKIKNDFVLRKIADDYVLVPTGDTALNFNGLAVINEVGAFIWEILERPDGCSLEDIVKSVLDEYDVDEPTARADAQEFIDYLDEHSMLLE